jgi:hypothetical protein
MNWSKPDLRPATPINSSFLPFLEREGNFDRVAL